MSNKEIKTLCDCGRPADGIDAVSRKPICKECGRKESHDSQENRIATDGGVSSDPDPDVGIQHGMDELPPGFSDLTDTQQRVMAGGFSRKNLIGLIRSRIESETSSKTDRLYKSELIDLLVILEESD